MNTSIKSIKYINIKKIKFLAALLGILFILFNFSSAAHAQLNLETPNADDQISIKITLDNPIDPIDDLNSFVKSILDIVLTIGIPIVALAIIYSGFLFVSARGNPEKLEEAKRALLYTLVGAAILLGAWVIAQAIGGTIEEIRRAV